MDWSTIEELALGGSEGMYIMVCKRVGRSENQAGRFDLTAAMARSMLPLVQPEERMEADMALSDRDGGVGDLDEPALRTVLRVAEAWTAQRIEQLAGYTVRVKLRAVSGDILKTFTVASTPAEPPEGDAPDPAQPGGPVDPATVSHLLLAGRGNVQGGVKDLIFLEERRHNLDRERRIENRSETMELLGYDRDRSNELIVYYKNQVEELRQDLKDLRRDHEKELKELRSDHRQECDRLTARIQELEGQANNIHKTLLEKAADARIADANAGTNEITVREIGRSVRELGMIGMKAGIVYTMRDKLTPELLSTLDKALSLDEDVLEMLNEPAVQAAMADPEFVAALQDPKQRRFLLDTLKLQAHQAEIKESA